MSAARLVANVPAGVGTGSEFSFDARDFERVRILIQQPAGISLHPGKQAMVYSRLSRRLRDTGHRSFAAYLELLDDTGTASCANETQEFINCLTTNLTSFFREEHHFHALADALAARAGAAARIWCSAASTGEEPYSVAMTVVETLGAAADVQIVASDIDTQVLAMAARGVYRCDAAGLSPQRLRLHCLRGTGANSGLLRIRPELARCIRFQAHNLLDAMEPLGEPFNIVFCRNVLIYFDTATQHRVLTEMHRAMKPGSLLFVGHSENFTDLRTLFRPRAKTVYERV